MKHIVSLSGGIGSWYALDMMIRTYGKEDVIAVFCDTLYEDGDLYRFLNDIELYYDIQIVRLCTGMTPVTLAYKDHFLYNSRAAKCSLMLKSKPFTSWLKEHYGPDDCEICLGIDYTEFHRTGPITKNYLPYKARFPLCERPYPEKEDMYLRLQETGIKRPRLYDMGFSHNNCGGRCFKAGIGHYKNLLNTMPSRYIEIENAEERIRQLTGKDVAILKRRGKPYPLKSLRIDAEMEGDASCAIDAYEDEIGGCGCFATLTDET